MSNHRQSFKKPPNAKSNGVPKTGSSIRLCLRELASKIRSTLLNEPDVDTRELLLRQESFDSWFSSLSNTPQDRNPYALHPAFKDWAEWNAVVLSMLKAKARLHSNLFYPKGTCDVNKIAEAALINIGALEGELDKAQWDKIFHLLKSGEKICISRALSFFNRADNRCDNIKRGKANSFRNRDFYVISKWVVPSAQTEEFPGFCALDNDSMAKFYAFAKGDNAMPMDGPNFSRARKGLGLEKCRKPTWRVREEEESLVIEPR